MLGENNSGSSIRLSLNKNLVISLASNPSSGFSWRLLAINTTILKKIGANKYVPSKGDEMTPGSGGREQLTFRAIMKGTTLLKLGYSQPWDHQAEPEEIFTLEVEVY
jgi:inhibitor of cysteine peptidase